MINFVDWFSFEKELVFFFFLVFSLLWACLLYISFVLCYTLCFGVVYIFAVSIKKENNQS